MLTHIFENGKKETLHCAIICFVYHNRTCMSLCCLFYWHPSEIRGLNGKSWSKSRAQEQAVDMSWFWANILQDKECLTSQQSASGTDAGKVKHHNITGTRFTVLFGRRWTLGQLSWAPTVERSPFRGLRVKHKGNNRSQHPESLQNVLPSVMFFEKNITSKDHLNIPGILWYLIIWTVMLFDICFVKTGLLQVESFMAWPGGRAVLLES